NARALGRVGGKTLLYFLITTLAAAVIGLFVALAAGFGNGAGGAARPTLLGENQTSPVTVAPPPTLVQTLVSLIPQNPFAAAATPDLLPLIVAVCVFGAAAAVTASQQRQAVVRFFEGINELSLVVITWLMRLAPAGVFVLIAVTIAKSGLGLLARLA